VILQKIVAALLGLSLVPVALEAAPGSLDAAAPQLLVLPLQNQASVAFLLAQTRQENLV
jgi:hypothetical protein